MHKTAQETFTLQKLHRLLTTKLPNIVHSMSYALQSSQNTSKHKVPSRNACSSARNAKTMHSKSENLTATHSPAPCDLTHFTLPFEVRLIHSELVAGAVASDLSTFQRSLATIFSHALHLLPSLGLAKWAAELQFPPIPRKLLAASKTSTGPKVVSTPRDADILAFTSSCFLHRWRPYVQEVHSLHSLPHLCGYDAPSH